MTGTDVLAEFRRAIERYCNQMNASTGVDLAGLRITVTIVTAREEPELRERVHRIARQYVRRQLPQAQLDAISFPLDPRLPDPGFRIDIRPAPPPVPHIPHVPWQPAAQTGPGTVPWVPPQYPQMTPAPLRPSASATQPAPPPEEAPGGPIRLRLRYEAFDWSFTLAPAALWLPMGRWPGLESRESAVRLPDFASFVPRGDLVQLRCYDDRLELRRTPSRPEYTVRVDGMPLLAGGADVTAGLTGSIAYLSGRGATTVLTYHLAPGGRP